MKKIVFYSWQSDLPNGTNRTLIEIALKEAAREIADDESIDIEPAIDRDTQGVSGAPDIATTIFKKIEEADIFVADISIAVKSNKRPTPNPNVLIELGYALKALGHERLVLVFNEAYGKKDKLPFDLKTRRLLIYNCGDSITDRSEIKKSLTKDLKAALLSGFTHVISEKKLPNIVDIIENNAPNKQIKLRAHLSSILSELEELQPRMVRDGGTVEDLLLAIPKTESLVVDFAKLSETVVLMNDLECEKEIFQWFGKFLTKHNPLPNRMNRFSNADGDFFKVLGHELFVTFTTPFLREGKLKELQKLLEGTLKVGPTINNHSETRENWTELSEYSPLLDEERKKRNPIRISLHADLLKERHEKEVFSTIIPIKDFTETDFFLYLYGEGTSEDEYYSRWYPQSVVWFSHTPVFLTDTIDYSKAIQLCHALKINDISELKKRLKSGQKFPEVKYYAITDKDIENIGSKGGGAIVYSDYE
ncbi:MAG: hypothetical protein Q8Q89_00580 [bacterium]|nr:hypothetical protein [bacterium]